MADSRVSSSDCLGKLSFLITRKGLILAAEIIISLIIIICYAVSQFGGYIVVAITEMIFALVLFVVFMMQLDKQLTAVNWLWTDFLRAIIGAVVYMITSIIVIVGFGDDAGIAAGAFGLVAGLLFAYDTFTIFLQIRASRRHTAASTDEKL
ncbi:proteolipid protein 2-like [Cololabis saira]|uniref:proteolipid protein 2-like n=1 Tax=Cololabis saira TaxID=129043 RepID=UPI002AD3045C|nr:proteolipid protein 2-like [Cololabis saira]